MKTWYSYAYTILIAIFVHPASSTGTSLRNLTFSEAPKAPGTRLDCAHYTRSYGNSTLGGSRKCQLVAYAWDVALNDLLAWNPSLSNGPDCELLPDLSYCIQLESYKVFVPDSSYCLTIDADQIPSGTATNCVCYTTVHGYEREDRDCEVVAEDSFITLSQLTTWNPWLIPDCDTALYADMDENDERAVCTAVNSTAASFLASAPPPETRTSSMVVGPTVSGTPPDCDLFYNVRPGDSCASIEDLVRIPHGKVYKWNPSVGPNCENLWLGYAYCVGRLGYLPFHNEEDDED